MKAFRHIAATAAASALIVGSALAAPTALAGTKAAELAGNTPQATVTVGARNVDPVPMWREKVAEHPDRVKEMWAPSLVPPFIFLMARTAAKAKPTG